MSDSDVKSCFSGTVARDVLKTLCGELLGTGIARTVYECVLRDDLVVKIETPSQSFQNILEWDLWTSWQKVTPIRRWLAPCESISPCGTVLLQRRTTPPGPKFKWPSKIPEFLTDRKRANFGLVGRRFVCHDYALVRTTLCQTFRKANWR